MDLKVNKLVLNNAYVEVEFLLLVETLPIEKLTKLPHGYNGLKIKYDEESL